MEVHNPSNTPSEWTCKCALKGAVGEQVLAPLELYTCLLEIANFVNQHPIRRNPNDPDDGAYICPNDILLEWATSQVPQGPFKQIRDLRHRVEFVQRLVGNDGREMCFPHLSPGESGA